MGWLRFSQGLIWTKTPVVPYSEVPPLYVAISGAALGFLFLAAALWMWAGWPGYRPLAATAFVLGALWFWLDRIFLTFNPAGNLNLTFLILATLFLGLFLGSVLISYPPANSDPQDVNHE